VKRKRYTEEQTIGAIKEHESGVKVDELCPQLVISNGTFYSWRSKYVGMEVSKVRPLKALEIWNNKLKK
jgi:putative transposase